MHLVHSCQVFDVAVQEVQRALAAIEQPHRKDLILYPDVVDFNDGTALCTFNPVLMSYLLIMCPSFGSATSSSYSQGIRAIRLLPTSDVTSFSAVGLDGDSPMGDVATTGPNRSTPMTRSAWRGVAARRVGVPRPETGVPRPRSRPRSPERSGEGPPMERSEGLDDEGEDALVVGAD